MKEILEILKYVLPSVVVFFTAYFIIKSLLKSHYKVLSSQQFIEINKERSKQITPVRLRAYERLILFLERISPDNMVLRLNKKGMTNQQLHAELINNISSEFHHNVAQQVYISSDLWRVVRSAKENTVKFLNIVNSKVKPDGPSIGLSQKVLEQVVAMKRELPTKIAIEAVKKEIRELF